MTLNKNPIDFTYEEVKERLTLMFKDRSILFDRAEVYYPTFSAVVHKVMICIEALINNSDNIQSLGDVEEKILYGGLSFIPIVLLANKHPQTKECCAALVLLVNNYLHQFPNQELEELIASLYNMIALEDKFSAILLASDVLLMQFKALSTKNQNYYQLSRNFVKEILGEDIITHE